MLSMDTHDPDPIDKLDVEGVGVGHLRSSRTGSFKGAEKLELRLSLVRDG
jgi:hypothetical protein